MEGWTLVLVRSARGEEYLGRAVDAGALELRPAEEVPDALAVMDRLAIKQRQRVGPFDPHAGARWPTQQAIDAARAEESPD